MLRRWQRRGQADARGRVPVGVAQAAVDGEAFVAAEADASAPGPAAPFVRPPSSGNRDDVMVAPRCDGTVSWRTRVR